MLDQNQNVRTRGERYTKSVDIDSFDRILLVSSNVPNLSLLGKWWWCFRNENDALWVKVIKNLYGVDGGFDSIRGSGLSKGVWVNIVKSGFAIDKVGINLSSSFVKKVGCGRTIHFWHDNWNIFLDTLKNRFPRLYAFELDKDCRLVDRWVCNNNIWSGAWNWRYNPRGRTLSELNSLLIVYATSLFP